MDTYANTSNYSTTFMSSVLIMNNLYNLVLAFISNILSVFYVKTLITNSIIFALKFLVLIAVLIFIRGGIPRYRYDFLTKIGWIKFLSLILSIFLLTILLTYLH